VSEQRGIGSGLNRAVRGFGITLVILGLAAILAPWMSAAAVVVLVGLVLLLGGAVLTLVGLGLRSDGKGNAGLAAGVLTLVCGLVLTFQPSIGLATVRWILVAYLFSTGATEITMARHVDADEGRLPALLSGLWTIALGVVMLIGWPISGARAIGILVGFKLVASGLTLIRLHGKIRSLGEKIASVRERLES